MDAKINLEAAKRIIASRVVKNSSNNYRSKLNTVKLFLISFEQETGVSYLSEDNEIILPLPFEVVKELFGWLSTNTNLPKRRRGWSPKQDQFVTPHKNATYKNNDDDLSENENESSDDEHDDDDDEPINEVEPVDIFSENKATVSHSCMQGYKSALKWFYSEKVFSWKLRLINISISLLRATKKSS
jgi:hypothetical protein